MYVENNCKKEAAYCVQSCLSTNGATAPSGPWPPSEDTSIRPCLLLVIQSLTTRFSFRFKH
jgi:hypothetical protein